MLGPTLPRSGADEAFERVACLAARTTSAPVALAGLLDRQRLIVRGASGMCASEAEPSLAQSFCRHVAERNEAVRIDHVRPDARGGAASDVVACLGVPVRAASGEVLGALCVTDSVPRDWTNGDEEALASLATMLTHEMERRDALSRLAAAERARDDDRALLRGGFDAIEDIFYVLDTRSRLVRWNSQLCAVSGYTPAELRGVLAEKLFVPEDRPRIHAAMAEAYQNGRAIVEATILSKDGREIAYEISGSPLLDRTGAQIGLCGTCRDITERKRAEASLRLSESRFRGLIEASPDLFFRVTADGRYLDIVAPDDNLLAKEKNSLIGSTLFESLPAPLAARIHSVMRAASESGTPQNMEYELTTQDGTDRLFEARIVPAGKDEVQAIIRDVTDYRIAERSVRESEVRFRSFVEATALVVWQADAEGNVTELGGSWAEFTGQTPEETEGWGWTDVLHPEDVPRTVEVWTSSIARRVPLALDYRVRRHDGVYHRFSVRGVPVFDGDAFLGWVGTCSDVEEKLKAEEMSSWNKAEMLQRERLLTGVASALTRLLTDDMDAAVPDALEELGRVTDADRVYVFGIHKGVLVDETLFSQHYEWAREGVEPQIDNPELQNCPFGEVGLARWESELKAGRSISGLVRDLPIEEQAVLLKLGIESILIVPIRTAGEVWGFLGFSDCSRARAWSAAEEATLAAAAASLGEAIQRQRQQAELAKNEKRLRLALDAANMGSWEVDAQTGAVTCSARTYGLFGLPEGDGDDLGFWIGHVLEEDRDMVVETITGAPDADVGVFVMEYRARVDGAIRWFRSNGRVERDARGRPTRTVGTARDITDEKVYEEALIEAKEAAVTARERAEETARMKSVLLANMSHEIRTPLTSIIGFADLLASEVSGDQQELVEPIVFGGRRLMHTLTSVLDLAQMEAGRRHLNLADVDVQAAVTSAGDLFRTQAEAKGLRFVVAPCDAPAVIRGEDAALHRIIANLVSNAIKFTESGGVTLSTSVASGAVTIRVQDTGVGIGESFVPALFEDFRQESEGEARRFEGNGLGLAISKRLAEMMGGTVTVESEKNVGSTFLVQFPLAG
ncbi:hypothetical protein BSZ36_15965 [Rubricoccus marinus]|uniref:histidine kinase n=1 Tax=Rubricoccus marinus TaxID=716817 RepID=A0A259U2Y3_9BACT|nr:hypothetical protein BSZ36_15965 [Rubricoccus marinus]